MKGSDGSEKLVGAVCEAWRSIDGVMNDWGDDSPRIRMPFIPLRWWETARRGIGSVDGGHV
jgi:hypothetical protein